MRRLPGPDPGPVPSWFPVANCDMALTAAKPDFTVGRLCSLGVPRGDDDDGDAAVVAVAAAVVVAAVVAVVAAAAAAAAAALVSLKISAVVSGPVAEKGSSFPSADWE